MAAILEVTGLATVRFPSFIRGHVLAVRASPSPWRAGAPPSPANRGAGNRSRPSRYSAWRPLGVMEVDSGRILYQGRDILAMTEDEVRRIRGKIAMIFQEPMTSL